MNEPWYADEVQKINKIRRADIKRKVVGYLQNVNKSTPEFEVIEDMCSIESCSSNIYCRRFCENHYRSRLRSGLGLKSKKICKVPFCNNKHLAQGFCQHHYYSARNNGIDENGLPDF